MTLPDRDSIEERVAIVAEAEGWTQGRAERVVARWHGFDSYGALLAAVKRQNAPALGRGA